MAELTGGWTPALAATAVVVLAVLLLLVLPPLRRAVFTRPMLGVYRRILPVMSQTEQEALNAGTVWWEGELFSGAPDWAKMHEIPQPRLTQEELHFLDHEVEEVCAMTDDWEVSHTHQDLPPQVWQYLKDHGFLGMIIPKRYGGLEFSAYMHSQVVTKLGTRSATLAISVMVPNSLGPAELLIHYGTEEQKDYYLPRLAKGLEVPAFGLTNPSAGSDAAAIPDLGVVCKGLWEGREVIGMRVTWEKRYITLGPICTILGLAFRLTDPDHLLGEKEDLGITCALVPTKTPGVNIGRRHWPLNASFQNGPNWGKDVFMPLDWIIGGPAMAGTGWRMLMECLAAGRSISLPSLTTAMAKVASRSVGAYARVRQQFKMPIGKFEGVEEALTRIAARTYMMDATRIMTAGAVDLGEKPAVASAIAKLHVTEMGRQVVNDAMDVLAGKGIMLGPNNLMARAYQQIPIAITVEGANILTRSLIVFGQGAIRCHPWVLKEMLATRNPDPRQGLAEFDHALSEHVKFALSNFARALVMGLTGSNFVRTPEAIDPRTRRYYQQLTRMSASFAFVSDVSMLVLGGGLKRREKLSARLGDVLSAMYLCSAALKRYEGQGRHATDAPLLHWAIWDTMYHAQLALDGAIANYPNRLVAWGLRRVVYPLGRMFYAPSDELGARAARILIAPSTDENRARDRLTAGMYLPKSEKEPLGALEAALHAALEAEVVEQKLRAAQREGKIAGPDHAALVEDAAAKGIIRLDEREALARYARLRDEVVRVDHFPQDFGVSVKVVERAAA
ncbi:MAG TPA: acyl-CoA dehydrogenase [Burkholderiales bacterium]|nr:acyl-CoA dehydrogenase [Burkholderiales bacterium]